MRWTEPAFEPYAVSAHSARSRHDDAVAGRPVVVPVYWQDLAPGDLVASGPGLGAAERDGQLQGLTVTCAPGGRLREDRGWPVGLGRFEDFWRGAHQSGAREHGQLEQGPLEHGPVEHGPRAPMTDRGPGDSGRAGRADTAWATLLVPKVWPPSERVRLTLRPSDARILVECLRQRYAAGSVAPAGSTPSAGPVGSGDPARSAGTEVVARHLARIDGEQDWGYLYLEVRRGHTGGRLVETVAMEWRATWGTGGTGAYRIGQANRNTVSELEERRFSVDGRSFRVRELPEWDRVAALRALRLPAAGSFRWSLSSVAQVTAIFAEDGPSREPDGPQDARR